MAHDGEESLLLPSVGGSKKGEANRAAALRSRAEKGIICNRFFIVVVLLALVSLSIRYQLEVNDLQAQLKTSAESIRQIKSTLAVDEAVIQRFNSSVTNTDVIAKLAELENSLSQTSSYLQNQLAETRQQVSAQLDDTEKRLSETVDKAEQQISTEVAKVKQDVEQYVITTQDMFSMENSFMVYQLAGTFTLLSCLISMWHMTAHLRKMEQPDVQRKILAILWMSPIYAVTSWFSLVFPSAEGYLAIIKDGYEAYIIYQFLSFCIAVIGRGSRDYVVDLLARHADHLTPPFRLLGVFEICGWCMPEPYPDNRALADAILLQCQLFAMQFVLFRPLTTTAMVVLKKLNYYGGGTGPADYRSPQFYVTIIQNLSIFTAFTGLLKFYHAVDKELAWCRPFAKFLCIKGVVFMTFWQGLCISILAQTTDVGGKDKQEWARSAQNFLICLEMLLFSIAHFYCFPTDEWQEGYRIKVQSGQFGDTIALGDFFQDVKLILTANAIRDKPKKKRRKSSSGVQYSPDDNRPSVYIGSRAGPAGERVPDLLDVERPESGGRALIGDAGDSFETASDGEDTETLSDNDEEFVKRALKRSLGIAGNDPDIAEATKRLLESKILQPEFFLGDDEPIPPTLYGSFIGNLQNVQKQEENDDDEESDSEEEDDEECPDVEKKGDQSHVVPQEDQIATSETVNRDLDDKLPADVKGEGGTTPLVDERHLNVSEQGDKVSVASTRQSETEERKSQNSQTSIVPVSCSESKSQIEGSLEQHSTPKIKPTSDEEDVDVQLDEEKPKRAYEQKGLEFLAPSDQHSGDLRPSIFTTIAKIGDRKKVSDKKTEPEGK